MKVLYLKSYYYPESLASSYLGDQTHEALVKAGAIIDLYTPMPSRGISEEIREKYKKIPVEKTMNGKFTIHRFPLIKEGRNSLLRALRYSLQCLKLFLIGVFDKDAKNADIMMVASTPPIIGATAALIKKIRKIPIAYNLQDIFPDSLVGTGMTKEGSIIWKIGRYIEDFTYRNSDKIIVISEDFKRNIMKKGVPESKIEVIYNWVDDKSIVPIKKEYNPLYEEFNIDKSKFTVLYAGNLSKAQNLSILLDAASKMKTDENVQFVIFGKGILEDKIKERINKEELCNVKLLPLQPYDKVSYVYSLGDVCVVSCKKGLGGAAMPSKTWSIMSCGRPVLANFDKGELKNIVESNKCGIFTDAENLDMFVSSIKYLKTHKEECEKMGNEGRRFIMNNLTKEVGTQKYVQVVKEIVLNKNKNK